MCWKFYQLAFFTPGSSPAKACIRNWYCRKDVSAVFLEPNLIEG